MYIVSFHVTEDKGKLTKAHRTENTTIKTTSPWSSDEIAATISQFIHGCPYKAIAESPVITGCPGKYKDKKTGKVRFQGTAELKSSQPGPKQMDIAGYIILSATAAQVLP